MEPQGVRPTAVAGTFYPQDPTELRNMVQGFLAKAPLSPHGEPEAFVAPHAGYVYSGQIAAYGYKNLKQAPADAPRRVYVLAPSHRVYLEGISVGNYTAYQTPLGVVEIDQEMVAKIAGLPDVSRDIDSHKQDHALEVHLPFLQETVVNFRLVPIMVGDISGGHLADILASCWIPGDLLIISSDLSHFHPYEKAVELDQVSHEAMFSGNPRKIESCESCGRTGMSALLEIARRQHWQPLLVNYGNSGDTTGDRGRVVGYATYLFYPEYAIGEQTAPPPKNHDQAPDLPSLVRNHLQQALTGQPGTNAQALTARYPDLGNLGASFVTLTKAGTLRGCIGSLAAHRSLAEDLLDNGVAAAVRDPRFPPVTADELALLKVEVSILSPAQPLSYRDADDLLALLKPGVHGVILQKDGYRSTFLPQVWEQLPNPKMFLEHLCKKAGLSGDCWQHNPQISTYTVEKVKEP